MGFPSGSDGKESTCHAGDLGLIPGLGRSPGGGRGNPLQYSYLENPHGQRSLMGYSPWGRTELDMTEQLSTAQTAAHQVPLSVGILQVRTLEWVAMPFSRGSSPPRNRTQVSHNAGRFLYRLSHQGSPLAYNIKL